MSDFVRKNGWEAPYHPLQITTWFLFPFFIALFYGVCIVNIDYISLQISLGLIGGILAIITLFLDYLTARIDPNAKCTNPSLDQKYCHLCHGNVTINSLHCRECGKCVENFDHHCLWLNTCVAGKNYDLFFTLLVVLSIFLFVQLGTATYALYVTIAITKIFIGNSQQIASFSFLVIYIILLVITFGNVLHLLGFHVMLKSKGVTTYEYVNGIRLQKFKAHTQQQPHQQHHKHSPPPPPPEGIFGEKFDVVDPESLEGDDEEEVLAVPIDNVIMQKEQVAASEIMKTPVINKEEKSDVEIINQESVKNQEDQSFLNQNNNISQREEQLSNQ